MVFTHPGTCPHCGMKLVHQSFAERKEMMNHYMKQLSICFYLQDGVEVLDFAGPMEAFSAAGFKVFTVSKKKGRIKTQGILTITPDYSIDDAPPAAGPSLHRQAGRSHYQRILGCQIGRLARRGTELVGHNR